MKPKSKPQPKTISAAKLAANRANAKKSTGPAPEGKKRSRCNSSKHLFYAKVLLPSQDTPEMRQAFQFMFERLDPRSGLEELRIRDFLNTRLRESLCLHFEKTVLLRQPASVEKDDLPFPFVREPSGVQGLNALSRRLNHLTRTKAKDIQGLLRAREQSQELAASGPPTAPEAASSGNPDADNVGAIPDSDPGGLLRAAFQGCLTSQSVILPGEDQQQYQAQAESLWSSFAPASLLQVLILSDFIETQWRLDRVPRIEEALLARRRISAKDGTPCDLGFAFINDAQCGQVLGSLEAYEQALRKRRDTLLNLFYQVRKAGWTDALSLQEETVPEAQPTSACEEAASGASAPPSSLTPLSMAGRTVGKTAPLASCSGSTTADTDRDDREHPRTKIQTDETAPPEPVPGTASQPCSSTSPAAALEASPAVPIALQKKEAPKTGIQQYEI